MTIRHIKTQHRTKNGGLCANCKTDYLGYPYSGKKQEKGYRVLVEIVDGNVRVTEPINLCKTCKGKLERETVL